MKIVFATNNQDKLKEVRHILHNVPLDLVSQAELGVPEVPENAPTFVENAIIKARHASAFTGLPAIADDSGLEVDALNGRPGVYSARYAGDNASYADNRAKLLQDLINVAAEKRTARFQTLVVYIRHANDPTPCICQGTWGGSILHSPCGQNGFGYDPLFFVPTHNCSAAELSAEVKNAISARAQAFKKLISILAT